MDGRRCLGEDDGIRGSQGQRRHPGPVSQPRPLPIMEAIENQVVGSGGIQRWVLKPHCH